MIKLEKRKIIFEEKKIIASELSKIQSAFFDKETLQLYREDNEEKIYLEKFDILNGKSVEVKTYNKVIGLHHKNINTFTKILSDRIKKLLEHTNTNELILISHLKIDFFGNRSNNYPPLTMSYSKLEKITKLNSYKETIQFNLEELEEVIEILFWTQRCDPSVAEYQFIFDIEEKLHINVCKYGNVHLTEYRQENLTKEVLKKLGWTIIEGQEFDNFSDDGKIINRELKMH